MAQQTARQVARREALAKAAVGLAARRAREARVEALTRGVVVALAERDAAVAQAENRAAECLAKLVDDEGLTVREVVDCCGDALTEREALRLRRLVRQQPGRTGPDAEDDADAEDDDVSATACRPSTPRGTSAARPGAGRPP